MPPCSRIDPTKPTTYRRLKRKISKFSVEEAFSSIGSGKAARRLRGSGCRTAATSEDKIVLAQRAQDRLKRDLIGGKQFFAHGLQILKGNSGDAEMIQHQQH